MPQWIKRQWDDIKGNVKYAVVIAGLTGAVIGINRITAGLSAWQQIVIAMFVLGCSTWAIFATFRWREASGNRTNKNPRSDETNDSVRLTIVRAAIGQNATVNSMGPSIVIFLRVRVLSSWNTTLASWKLSLFYGDNLLTPATLEYGHGFGFQHANKPGEMLPPKIEFVSDQRLHEKYQLEPLPVNSEIEDWLAFSVSNTPTIDNILGADFHLSAYDGQGIFHKTVRRPGYWMNRVVLIGKAQL